jgi:hypothetical protein
MMEDEKILRKLRKVRRQMEEEMKGMTSAEQVAYTNQEGRKNIEKLGLEKYVIHSKEPVVL